MQTAVRRQDLQALLPISSREGPEGPQPWFAGRTLRENESGWGSQPTLCTDGGVLSQGKKIKTSCSEMTLIW